MVRGTVFITQFPSGHRQSVCVHSGVSRRIKRNLSDMIKGWVFISIFGNLENMLLRETSNKSGKSLLLCLQAHMVVLPVSAFSSPVQLILFNQKC